jgi:hypothetical protein
MMEPKTQEVKMAVKECRQCGIEPEGFFQWRDENTGKTTFSCYCPRRQANITEYKCISREEAERVWNEKFGGD